MLYHQILTMLVGVAALCGALAGTMALLCLAQERRKAVQAGGRALRAWTIDASAVAALVVAAAVTLWVWGRTLGVL